MLQPVSSSLADTPATIPGRSAQDRESRASFGIPTNSFREFRGLFSERTSMYGEAVDGRRSLQPAAKAAGEAACNGDVEGGRVIDLPEVYANMSDVRYRRAPDRKCVGRKINLDALVQGREQRGSRKPEDPERVRLVNHRGLSVEFELKVFYEIRRRRLADGKPIAVSRTDEGCTVEPIPHWSIGEFDAQTPFDLLQELA